MEGTVDASQVEPSGGQVAEGVPSGITTLRCAAGIRA